jgi:hypothetical protein
LPGHAGAIDAASNPLQLDMGASKSRMRLGESGIMLQVFENASFNAKKECPLFRAML